MTKPLAYLRDRPIGVLALAMAYKRVMDRQTDRREQVTRVLSTDREHPQKADRQMRLPIDEPATPRT